MLLIDHKSKNKAEMVEKRNWQCKRERREESESGNESHKIYSNGVGVSYHS